MNLNKIKTKLDEFSVSMKNDLLTNKEFLIFIANLTMNFALAGLSNDEQFAGLNLSDANILESLSLQHPDNLFIAMLLQSHITVYWANQIEE